jgi:ATP-dependent Clp protease ATP-binding subunit ClpA
VPPRSSTARPALGYLRLAAAEARALGHDYVGTGHLLLVLLARPGGPATVALERVGVPAEQIRFRLRHELDEPAGPRIDPEALATLGIDLGCVRARIEEAFGPGALEQTKAGCMGISPCAKVALASAVGEAHGLAVRDDHVLVGLLHAEGSLAGRVLTEVGLSAKTLN